MKLLPVAMDGIVGNTVVRLLAGETLSHTTSVLMCCLTDASGAEAIPSECLLGAALMSPYSATAADYQKMQYLRDAKCHTESELKTLRDLVIRSDSTHPDAAHYGTHL